MTPRSRPTRLVAAEKAFVAYPGALDALPQLLAHRRNGRPFDPGALPGNELDVLVSASSATGPA